MAENDFTQNSDSGNPPPEPQPPTPEPDLDPTPNLDLEGDQILTTGALACRELLEIIKKLGMLEPPQPGDFLLYEEVPYTKKAGIAAIETLAAIRSQIRDSRLPPGNLRQSERWLWYWSIGCNQAVDREEFLEWLAFFVKYD